MGVGIKILRLTVIEKVILNDIIDNDYNDIVSNDNELYLLYLKN